MVLGALPLFLAGLVLDSSDPRRALAWTLAGVVAGTTYSALFLGLAALTRHAVVAGLLFVLLWEGLLGGLLNGIRWLAIGAWGRQVAAAVSDQVAAPGTGLTYAVVAAAVVTSGRSGSPATDSGRSRCVATNDPAAAGRMGAMEDAGSPDVIPVAVRVHLSHPAMEVLAREADVDLLHIKGPALLPGLRPPGRSSSDVDVIVRPGRRRAARAP